jgi:site-specific recombinase XerD
MAVYQDGKTGNWKADVWFNSRRYCTKTFTKKAFAEKYVRDRLYDLEVKQLTGSSAKDCTYNEIYNLWYVNASSRKRETSLIKDSQMHRDYIEPIIGKRRISEITPSNFEEIVSEMLEKGLNKSSVNKVIQHFKAVFNHSFNNETIARNPSKSFKQLKLHQKEMDFLSQEEMDALLTFTNERYISEDRWKHVLYLTLFLTGGRLGEVLGLEWHRIQFERNSILIGQTWCSIERKLIFTTKGKKDRIIPLNQLLKKELASIKNNSKSSFLFSENKDRPIDPSNFRSRYWEKDFRAAGVRRVRIHDARHTYASLFMMNNGSLYDLKEILGHSSIKTTERYAHLSNAHLAGVRDIIKPNIGNKADVISVDSFPKMPLQMKTIDKSSLSNHSLENALASFGL